MSSPPTRGINHISCHTQLPAVNGPSTKETFQSIWLFCIQDWKFILFSAPSFWLLSSTCSDSVDAVTADDYVQYASECNSHLKGCTLFYSSFMAFNAIPATKQQSWAKLFSFSNSWSSISPAYCLWVAKQCLAYTLFFSFTKQHFSFSVAIWCHILDWFEDATRHMPLAISACLNLNQDLLLQWICLEVGTSHYPLICCCWRLRISVKDAWA